MYAADVVVIGSGPAGSSTAKKNTKEFEMCEQYLAL
jgi:flavin-dependent dehydrogenase